MRPAAVNYYWLGAVYAARGDKEKALATMQKAFEMDSAILPCSIRARTSLRCGQIRGSNS